MFNTMNYNWLVALGTRFTPFLMKTGLPIDGLIRKTIFKQFVGGETLGATAELAAMLSKYNVKVILDYGVEAKEGEASFDKAAQAFIRTIEFAAAQKNVPYVSIKVTGFARFKLLHSLDEAPRLRSGIHDAEEQNEEWIRVKERMYRICQAAYDNGIGVLVDAEESWIQDPIDRLTMEVMEEFNKERVVVYNTIQLYRHDRLDFMKLSHNIARQQGFKLGVKLVRGAYMEKERAYSQNRGLRTLIQPDKAATDRDYNASVTYCLEHLDDMAVVIATHNEDSNRLAVEQMEQKGILLNDPRIHFSQLLGMSDNITFNLAKAGCSVSKYVPYGPIRDVIPYLMRRAQENSSVAGQTGREYAMLENELKRRKAQ